MPIWSAAGPWASRPSLDLFSADISLNQGSRSTLPAGIAGWSRAAKRAYSSFVPGNAQITIRRAEPGDASQIAALLIQLGYPSTSDEVSQRLAYWLPDPMSLVLVAELGGRLAGCLSLHAIPYLERTGRWARIESLVVDQSARGRGTGRSLMAAAEAAARDWQCSAVEVTSLRTRTEAHAFYKQLGYADSSATSGRFVKALDR